MLRLYDKFPRQLGLYSSVFSRKNINNFEEMLEKINLLNGKIRVFVSVYNYTNKDPEYKNVEVDKIFIDFDSDKCYENICKLHSWLKKQSLRHLMVFSGGKFHTYILTKKYKELKNKKTALYNAHHFIAKELNFTIGDPDKCDIDEHIPGNLAQLATFPGTFNTKRRRYSICITEEDLQKGYGYIKEKAKQSILTPKYYGNKLFDISKFDSERVSSNTVLELSTDIQIKINKDKFLQSVPKCVTGWLTSSHVGYTNRKNVICYLRDKGYLLPETIQILKQYLTESEFIHCTTKRVAKGYREPGEEQPQYLYRDYVRSKVLFPPCKTIKGDGDCPFEKNKKCKNWRIYK